MLPAGVDRRAVVYAVLSLVSIALIPLGPFPGLAVIRAAPTVLLAAFAFAPTRPTFGNTIAWGLLLGAAGDGFLNTFDPDLGIFGVLAFGAGHVCYIAGLRRSGWAPNRVRRLMVAGLVAFGLCYGAVIAWENPLLPVRRIAWLVLGPAPLPLPVAPALLAYMPLLIGMACVAVLRRGSRTLAAGALVFVSSDAMIPLNQFLLPKAPGAMYATDALMYSGFFTYYLGQYLIAHGAMAEATGAAPPRSWRELDWPAPAAAPGKRLSEIVVEDREDRV